MDGYTGYNALTKEDRVGGPIIKIGCWAHARRKFDETYKATKSPLAKRMMRLIQQMYCVEDVAAGLTADQRLDLRQEKTRPILSAIWADLLKNESNSHGKLRGAINYVLKARDAFTYFVEDGRLEIDNNPVERCIRGIAITKKNSLFAGSHGMAEVWAIFFTLIETCKLNKINPRLYLNWAAGEIELNRGDVDYAMLLPWHCPVGRIEV